MFGAWHTDPFLSPPTSRKNTHKRIYTSGVSDKSRNAIHSVEARHEEALCLCSTSLYREMPVMRRLFVLALPPRPVDNGATVLLTPDADRKKPWPCSIFSLSATSSPPSHPSNSLSSHRQQLWPSANVQRSIFGTNSGWCWWQGNRLELHSGVTRSQSLVVACVSARLLYTLASVSAHFSSTGWAVADR